MISKSITANKSLYSTFLGYLLMFFGYFSSVRFLRYNFCHITFFFALKRDKRSEKLFKIKVQLKRKDQGKESKKITKLY